MKNITLLVLAFLASAIVFSQSAKVKFQNNRFSNIKVQPVNIVNANEFYSDFFINEDLQNSMSKVFTQSDLDFIIASAHEKALPPALNSLDKRDLNRDKMKYLSLYRLWSFTSGDTEISILIAPVSENLKAKPVDMIGDNDMILFFNTSVVIDAPVKETPNKPISQRGYSCQDYSDAIVMIFDSGIKITMPADSIPLLLPDAVLQSNGLDFREEYLIMGGEKGLKEVTLVCDKDGDKPLYEVIFEFENADSTYRLAELMFGPPNHPQLDNYWVLGVNGKNAVSLVWTFNNKLVIASNLPGTEMEDSEDFMLSDEFIAKFNGTENTQEVSNSTNSETEDNEATSLAVNNLINAAVIDFDAFKTELMPNKTEDYNADLLYN
jgi:hypothetical protein